MGNNNTLTVAGIGFVLFKTKTCKLRKLCNVQYVPKLAHNLLSIGQLVNSECTVMFTDQGCTIKDKVSNQLLAWVQLTQH